MDQYTESYFTQIYDQISNVVEGEGTYNIIAANATVNPAFRQTTGGIARLVTAKKADLIGMTPEEIDDDPYKATAKFLSQSITDVAVRVFDNTHKQLMKQGMSEEQAAVYAERIASNTAKNLVQPLYADTFEQQRNAADNLISIMTKPNLDNGKIEIDLSRITVDPQGQHSIGGQISFMDEDRQYTVKPIESESYTPYISRDIDLGGEWLEGFFKGVGALGSSTLVGQAITGTGELFGFDATEWLGARREFEREVMRGDHGTAWSFVYGGRDMTATIAETAAIMSMTGGYVGPVLQTPIRSFLNEWIEEEGQLSMQYVTDDSRQQANTSAIMTNLLFDTATMSASVGLGKFAESAFQSFAVTNSAVSFLRDTVTGTLARNVMRTGLDLGIDVGVDFAYYNVVDANMEDEGNLTQNTRNIYDKLARMPDFTDPEYNEAMLNFIGRKMAGRFIGGLKNLKSKNSDPYYDTPEYHRTELKMNKLVSYINRIMPPSSFKDVDILLRGRAQTGSTGAITLKNYIDGGGGFKDLFKLYLDREFAQSKILTQSKIHSAIFGETKLFNKIGLGKIFSTVPSQDKLYAVTQVMDDMDRAVRIRNVDETNASIAGTKVADAIVGKMVSKSFETKDEQFVEYAASKQSEQGDRTEEEFLKDARIEYNKYTDNRMSLSDDDAEHIVTEAVSWAQSTLNHKNPKAKAMFLNSFIRSLDKQMKKYGFAENHKAALMKAAEHLKNQTVPKGTKAPKRTGKSTFFTDQDRLDFQQEMTDKFVNSGNIAKKRTIMIAKEGEEESKTVDVDSEEFASYIQDKIKRIRGMDFLSGIGVRNPEDRKLLEAAQNEVQTLAGKLLSDEAGAGNFEDAAAMIARVKPILKDASSKVVDSYTKNIIDLYKSPDTAILSADTKNRLYLENLKKINNMTVALGDMLDVKLQDAISSIQKESGLDKILGRLMSNNKTFDFAYERAKEKYGDTELAREKTFDEAMAQYKENAFYIKVKKSQQDRLLLGHATKDMKLNDIMNLTQWNIGRGNKAISETMMRVIARSKGIEAIDEFFVLDSTGKIIFKPEDARYVNKYMETYITSLSADAEGFKAKDIKAVLRAMLIKYNDVESKSSQNLLDKIVARLDSYGIKLNTNAISIDDDGIVRMADDYLSLKDTQTTDADIVLDSRLTKNANRILHDLVGMYWKADLNDRSQDTVEYSVPATQLFHVGDQRYYSSEILSMFDQAINDKHGWGLSTVITNIAKMTNTADDAIELTKVALKSADPSLYEAMNKTATASKLFNSFVNTVIQREYVIRQQIASIDIKTNNVILAAEKTGSGSLSMYNGVLVFSIKDDPYDDRVKYWKQASAGMHARRGWIPLWSKGADGSKLFVKLPKLENNAYHMYAYKKMVDRFKDQFAELGDNEVGLKAMSILNQRNDAISTQDNIRKNLGEFRDFMVKELKSQYESKKNTLGIKYEADISEFKILPGDTPEEIAIKQTGIEALKKTELVDPSMEDVKVKGKSVWYDLASTLKKQIATLEALEIPEKAELMSMNYTFAHYGLDAMIADSFAKRGGSLGVFGDPNERVAAWEQYLESSPDNFRIAIIPSVSVDGVTIDDGQEYMLSKLLKVTDKIYGTGRKATVNIAGTLIKQETGPITKTKMFDNLFGDDSYLNYSQITFAPNMKVISPDMIKLFEKNTIKTKAGVEIVMLTGENAKAFLKARFLHAVRNPEVHDVSDPAQLSAIDKISRRYANERELQYGREIVNALKELPKTKGPEYAALVKKLLRLTFDNRKPSGSTLVVNKWESNGYGHIDSYKLVELDKMTAKTMYGDDTGARYSSVGALPDTFIAGAINKLLNRIENGERNNPFSNHENFMQFKRYAMQYIDLVNKGEYTEKDIQRINKEYGVLKDGFKMSIDIILNVLSNDKNPVFFKEDGKYFFIATRSPLTTRGAKAAQLLTHIIPNSSSMSLSGTHIKAGDLDFDGDTANLVGNNYLSKMYKDYYNDIRNGKGKTFKELGLTSVIEIVNNYYSDKAMDGARLSFKSADKGTKPVDLEGVLGKFVSHITKNMEYSTYIFTENADKISTIVKDTYASTYESLSPKEKKAYDFLVNYTPKEVSDKGYGIIQQNGMQFKGMGTLGDIRFSHVVSNKKVGVSDVPHNPALKNVIIVEEDRNGIGHRIHRHGQLRLSGDNKELAIKLMNDIDDKKSIGGIDSIIEELYKGTDFIKQYNMSKEVFKKGELPKHIVDINLKNANGTLRLASTNGNVITINPVKKDVFFNYITGKDLSETSQQKKIIIENLSKIGYSVQKIQSIIQTDDDVKTFLILHEADHIKHKDHDVYWKFGKDLLTQDKIDIELRATINALESMENGSYHSGYRLVQSDDIMRQIYRAGTDNPKTGELTQLANDIPTKDRESYIQSLVRVTYTNSLLDFDGFRNAVKTNIEGQSTTEGVTPRFNQFRFTEQEYTDVVRRLGNSDEAITKMHNSIASLNDKLSDPNTIAELENSIYNSEGKIDYETYKDIKSIITRGTIAVTELIGYDKKNKPIYKTKHKPLDDMMDLLHKTMPAFIEKTGLDINSEFINEDALAKYPGALIRAAVVYQTLMSNKVLGVSEEDVREKFFVGPIADEDVEIKLGPQGPLNDTVFDTDMAELLTKKLHTLYPEIKAQFSNTPVWFKDENVFNQTKAYDDAVSYRFKAVDTINKNMDKILSWENNKSIPVATFWKKVGELGVPKNQLKLIIESNGDTLAEKLSSFISTFSYTVETKTAMEDPVLPQWETYSFEGYTYYPIRVGITEQRNYYKQAYGQLEEIPISKEEYELNKPPLTSSEPTQYYARLSRPGGTNYTENEIRVKGIEPVQKGHAEFSTKEGIGWFRSDDKIPISTSKDYYEMYLEEKNIIAEYEDVVYTDEFQKWVVPKQQEVELLSKQEEGIRRIQEIQSDLFQKNRDGKWLAFVDENHTERSDGDFLQLLNKDGNWINFFVKSIVQDSAKKGYNKVWFPTGETAAKIEGHEVIAERLADINERIDKFKQYSIKKLKLFVIEANGRFELRDRNSNRSLSYFRNFEEAYQTKLLREKKQYFIGDENFETKQEAEDYIAERITRLEQARQRYKTEGLEKLAPIEAFYENRIKNILNKTYGNDNVKLVTDEHGSTWREVTINQNRDLAHVLLQRDEAQRIIGQANIKAGTILIDAINQKQDTIPHEYAHHYIAWFKNTPIIQEGIKRFGSEEALVQAVGEQVVRQKGEAYNLWKSFTVWLRKVFSNREILQVITDGFLTRKDLTEIGFGKEYTGDALTKDGLPVRIKNTGVIAKVALDDMYDDLMTLAGQMPNHIMPMVNRVAAFQDQPLDYSSLKLRTAEGLFKKIAQINNANKASKLDDLTHKDVEQLLQSFGITVTEEEGKSPVLMLGKKPLNISAMYELVKKFIDNSEKELDTEAGAKYPKSAVKMDKRMDIYETYINGRNTFNAIASMLNINQRKALYFRSKGINSNVAKKIQAASDKATQMPRLSMSVLEEYAKESINSTWKIDPNDIDAGIINFKTIMENC